MAEPETPNLPAKIPAPPAGQAPPAGIDHSDYAAIEKAVMETARGRWFLLEYARRQRAAETQNVMDAIGRLETMISGFRAPVPAIPESAPAPSVPVQQPNETAAQVAERLYDLAWGLRETGAPDALCDDLERQAAIVGRLDLGSLEFATDEEPSEAEPDEAIVLAAPTPAPSVSPHVEALARFEAQWAQPRVAARPLARLDDLPLAEKLRLFA